MRAYYTRQPSNQPAGWCAENKSQNRPENALLTKACTVGPCLAGIWELGFREHQHHSLIRMVHCASTIYANSVVYAEHLLF